MKALRMPENVGSHLFIGEDRHPVSAPQNANQVTEITSAAPDKLTPVLGSVDKDTRELNLLLVQSADEHLQGVVRLNGTLYPALATPSADNSQLVINALTDKGLRFAGYGEAVNHDADSTNRPAPELMQFHLKTREEPLFAVYTPEKQPDALYRNRASSSHGSSGPTAKSRRTGRKNSASGSPTAPADEPVRKPYEHA